MPVETLIEWVLKAGSAAVPVLMYFLIRETNRADRQEDANKELAKELKTLSVDSVRESVELKEAVKLLTAIITSGKQAA